MMSPTHNKRAKPQHLWYNEGNIKNNPHMGVVSLSDWTHSSDTDTRLERKGHVLMSSISMPSSKGNTPDFTSHHTFPLVTSQREEVITL